MARPKKDPNAEPTPTLTPRERAHKVMNARVLRVAAGCESVTAAILSRNYSFTREEIESALDYLNGKFEEMTKAADTRFTKGLGAKREKPSVSFFGTAPLGDS